MTHQQPGAARDRRRRSILHAAIACATLGYASPAGAGPVVVGGGYPPGPVTGQRATAELDLPARLPDPRPPRRPLAPDLTSTLPFASTCSQPYPNANRAISLDSAGTIYAVAICGAEVQMTASIDGGAGWSPPVPVSDPVITATSATVEGGTMPDHAIVAWSDGNGVGIRTTTDAGRTFSPIQYILPGILAPSQGLDAVAVGSTYHVMVADSLNQSAVLQRSLDGGGAWEPEVRVPMPWVYGDLLHDPSVADEAVMELVSDNPSVYRTTSTDGAASFPPNAPLAGGCCIYYSDWSVGCGLLVASGGADTSGGADLLWRHALPAGAPVEQLFTLPSAIYQSRSVEVDGSGSAFTLGAIAADSRIELQRWRAGAPGLDAAIVVAPMGSNPHLATCGAGTVLVLHEDVAGLIQFAKYCLDGGCCGQGACSVQPVVTLLRNGDVTARDPPSPRLADILLAGDGSGLPGRTALDIIAPAERYPGFAPGPLADELVRLGPLVFYELEAADGVARILRLAKSGADLDIRF